MNWRLSILFFIEANFYIFCSYYGFTFDITIIWFEVSY